LPFLTTLTVVTGVPEPATVPWPGIATYTEAVYRIDVKVGEEFAVGLIVSMDSKHGYAIGTNIALENEQIVQYPVISSGKYGTDWFLFKAVSLGETTAVFNYPLEYFKSFLIVVS
jgi:hypothetical protein